ncbi:GNAT family N-acetyltransferase [Pseudomonas oryzihabitans]|uniref:GNAT family N-acetyltransferase n=1 Tax=Pseudomonas oryzihabitans TaxID=47885 RepID=UPI00135E038A|nr:GNAT family N-acetyltransferase [Pseudomonas oryzihabitans]MXS20969.1 GNAT family N-acetyltransferase [Pseudomonas oryzihabitans]
MDIQLLHGAAITPLIPELAELRIAVFREFPYLYDGTLDYESRYLQTYAEAPDSLCVLVRDAGRVVGAATALPLADETAEFHQPFRAQGWPVERIYYFGESLLLPAYRGQGLGRRFFAEREARARQLGRFAWCAFCAVQRPDDHPRRPVGYRPLHGLWHGEGFVEHPELLTHYFWQDLDEMVESPKPMTFWLKELP